MSRRILAPLVALAVLALPAPAHADRWVGDDAVGDAVAWRFEEDACSGAETTSDDAPGQDITALAVRHQPRRLVVKIRYAAPATATERWFWLHVRTPRHDLMVDISRYRGRWHVQVGRELEFEPGMYDSDGDGIDDCEVWYAVGSSSGCRGRELEIGADAVTLALPRACLRDPAWVEVGAESWSSRDDVVVSDEWGTSEPELDPNVHVYGDRVSVSPGQKASPSNRSRVTNSETSLRRSFVISRAGLPIGTTAATAY